MKRASAAPRRRRPASGGRSGLAVGDRAPAPPRGRLGLRLHLAAGRAGLDRQIQLARVQRPGLALTGFTDYIRYGRVQIVGGSEISYLAKLAGLAAAAPSCPGWPRPASPASS